MLLGLGRDLERLQLTIGFIAVWFGALVGIAAIYIFMDVLSKAVLSVLLCDYFIGMVESIVTPYRIIMILLKDLLLQ
jgi:VIT1/CCC1 family predicted Fe2+/Mn2+ transporter